MDWDAVEILPTPEGITLKLAQAGREPLFLALPIEGAISFWFDWWKALGRHYPREHADPEAMPPTMLSTGQMSYRPSILSNGNVGLWIRPTDCSGIVYEFKPTEARKLAQQLLDSADQVEQLVKPN
jgi:hypothetical protein